jgi:predicted transcriptional regulator
MLHDNESTDIVDDIKTASPEDLTMLTSDIVAAYVSHNSVQPAQLPELIAAVHASLGSLGKPSASVEPEAKASPAEIRKSIRPDGLVSFIDGKSYKTLKRHLAKHGLDGAAYRAKYGLPHDYPMVAASYAAQRSELAKALGLGQVRRNGGAPPAAEKALDEMTDSLTSDAEAPAPKKRGGRKPAAAKAAATAAVKAEPARKAGGRPRKAKGA